MLRVKDCMDISPETVTPSSSLREAIEIMLDANLEGLAVVGDKKKSLGLLTLGYLLRGFVPDHLRELPETMLEEIEEVNSHAFFGPTSRLFLVADFFKEDVKPLEPDIPLIIAACEIRRQMLPLLPVVKKTKLVGVLYQSQIMRGFLHES
ncbi:CBS domain-containing protein [candidate division WOR-3 bacterium]|uniref:CBS domain-containing protein n=1 Tax=candidate division WOR-3 bacterium TaxID=2052148 RepID=A0A9D5QDG7_UNCW3|nr:CBS domain-containing protein [candidate division WOR-3 bacterium]MBD3365082.1 CBS domain-containing protein [candidate division WOR-3 bacterium]